MDTSGAAASAPSSVPVSAGDGGFGVRLCAGIGRGGGLGLRLRAEVSPRGYLFLGQRRHRRLTGRAAVRTGRAVRRGGQGGHLAGGLAQQIGAHRLLLVYQQNPAHRLLAGTAPRAQRHPFLHRLALAAGQVQAAGLYHLVECGKAVVPFPGHLYLIHCGIGQIHLQPVPAEKGRDVLGGLDGGRRALGQRRRALYLGIPAHAVHGARQQRPAYRQRPQPFHRVFIECKHKHDDYSSL